MTDVGRYDLSQGGLGGSGYTDRAAALAAAGSLSIVRVSLLVDSYGGLDRNIVINGISAASRDVTAEAVPEPASMVLLGTGLIGVLAAVRRRK